MKRVLYNKLIRDKIVDKIKLKGEGFETKVLSDEKEFRTELLKKVLEEADELSKVSSKEEFLSELSDLSVVVSYLKKVFKVNDHEVEKSLKENELRKGGFEKRLFLLWSEQQKRVTKKKNKYGNNLHS